MSRTPAFRHLKRLFAVAEQCSRSGEPATEALQRLREVGGQRRRLLKAGVAGGLAGVLPQVAFAARGAKGADVAVVGAGFAGLYAAHVLAGKGAAPTVFEAGDRVGGRVWSLRGLFPGQVAERGAELIDTTHTTVRGLARRYGLQLESYARSQHPGEEFFYFNGRHYSEAEVVEEYRAFVPAMKADLTRIGNGPTALEHSAAERALDNTSLRDYLVQRGAGPLLRQVLDVAYTIEFGREIDRQSALSLLFFAAVNRRKAFTPFGISDERFHIVEGNDRIPTGLAGELPTSVRLGHRLVRVARAADGRVRLSFATGSGAGVVESLHAAVVLALPAPLMREVEFAASAELPATNRLAIDRFEYGTSSKLVVGFNGRPWWERQGSNGASTSDLPHHQSTWETNPSMARNLQRGVLTHFMGGSLGERLDPTRSQAEAVAFLSDLDRVYPGSAALARRDGRQQIVAHAENWSLLPLFKGGYSNNQPGYFTSLEGLYARPAGNIYFAGEHTDSFYGYQGFMEGALVSGARAADEVLRQT
ncbi:MAG TPA: NAD(P)/FAD-dependent oxidoreductase [Rubrivivax sp.]|nr:NAD(P)/FAD-dependent oxidoreductase [Rubrivivax sp.]